MSTTVIPSCIPYIKEPIPAHYQNKRYHSGRIYEDRLINSLNVFIARSRKNESLIVPKPSSKDPPYTSTLKTSTPSTIAFFPGICPLLINSAALAITGSIPIVATATTTSPFV